MENKGEILLYTNQEEKVEIQVIFHEENVWLTQKRLAELFGVDVRTINEHLKNIYREEELQEEDTIKTFPVQQEEGTRIVKRNVNIYNLDAIISVGYRVSSLKATQFRKWATSTLKEYVLKGFVIDAERLKNGAHFGKDYFEELLEKIREIRASERRFYQKITDIYSQCSSDYDSNSKEAKDFFAEVQNKLEWAITGKTAAELIYDRADSKKKNMGLITWKNAPKGKILKPDVRIAKNYLREEELKDLNQIVTMYLDFAELQAKKRKVMTMRDWAERLDAFLEFNEYEILKNKGTVSAKVAKALAEEEYSKFRVIQDKEFKSDFDKAIEKFLK